MACFVIEQLPAAFCKKEKKKIKERCLQTDAKELIVVAMRHAVPASGKGSDHVLVA